MTPDFTNPKECHFRQEDHVDDIVFEWPENFKESDEVLSPAFNTLFEKG